MWQALYEELRDRRFVVIAVALDKSAEDARPWIEKAAPTYPALVDTQHVVADLYNIVNVPTALDQQARAEFGLAEWLARHGEAGAAEPHFVRAGELAPHDFTIRRGSMPIRGIDPMGPQFREMIQAWAAGGRPYYRPLPDTRG